MDLTIRKLVTLVDEIHREGGRPLARPRKVAAAIAVIDNPFAGRFEEDLSLLSETYSATLGPQLAQRASEALGAKAVAFGKASLVGLGGEVTHGSAIIHTRRFGDALRAVSTGQAPVSSAEKRGPAGASVDVALRGAADTGALDGTDTAFMFNWEVRVPDAPQADEIVVIAAVADGGRPDARVN